ARSRAAYCLRKTPVCEEWSSESGGRTRRRTLYSPGNRDLDPRIERERQLAFRLCGHHRVAQVCASCASTRRPRFPGLLQVRTRPWPMPPAVDPSGSGSCKRVAMEAPEAFRATTWRLPDAMFPEMIIRLRALDDSFCSQL